MEPRGLGGDGLDDRRLGLNSSLADLTRRTRSRRVMKTMCNFSDHKTLFTAEAVANDGRSGTVVNPDGLLNVQLGNPLEPGKEKIGPSPEVLFAGAYAACYHGALFNAAKKLNVSAEGSTVRAKVSLREDAQGGYSLAVELHALLPKSDPTDAKHVMEAAHETCPYSKALRGDAVVSLVVDPVAGA